MKKLIKLLKKLSKPICVFVKSDHGPEPLYYITRLICRPDVSLNHYSNAILFIRLICFIIRMKD